MEDEIFELMNHISSRVSKNYDEDLFASDVLDSLGMARLIVELEEYFQIEIPIEDIAPENFVTVCQIAQLVSNIRGKNHGSEN